MKRSIVFLVAVALLFGVTVGVSVTTDTPKPELVSVYRQAWQSDTTAITDQVVKKIQAWFFGANNAIGRKLKVVSNRNGWSRKQGKAKTFVVSYYQDSVAAGMIRNFGEAEYEDSTVFILYLRLNRLLIFNEYRLTEQHSLDNMIFVDMYDSTLFSPCTAIFQSEANIRMKEQSIYGMRKIDEQRKTKPDRRPEDTTVYTCDVEVRYKKDGEVFVTKKRLCRSPARLKDMTADDLLALLEGYVQEAKATSQFQVAKNATNKLR